MERYETFPYFASIAADIAGRFQIAASETMVFGYLTDDVLQERRAKVWTLMSILKRAMPAASDTPAWFERKTWPYPGVSIPMTADAAREI